MRPPADAIVRMPPLPRASMPGKKHLMVKKVEVRLLSMLERQSSSLMSCTGTGLSVPPPAKASTKSGAPKCAWTASRMRSTCVRSEQSAGMAIASTPSACTAARLACKAATSRPLIAKRTPLRARARQVAAPMPREPPVTNATLPRKSPKTGATVSGPATASGFVIGSCFNVVAVQVVEIQRVCPAACAVLPCHAAIADEGGAAKGHPGRLQPFAHGFERLPAEAEGQVHRLRRRFGQQIDHAIVVDAQHLE